MKNLRNAFIADNASESITADEETITNLNIKLSTKLKNDGGDGTANAADVGGTTVNFAVSFIDVSSITVTAVVRNASFEYM